MNRARPFATLRELIKRPPQMERCQLCHVALPSNHQHLVEPATRKLVCSCQVCSMLFSGRSDARYRLVPKDSRLLADFQLSDAQWDALLFSGTIFHEAEDGGLYVAQIPWDREAAYRLPVRVWKEMMDHYYPNTAWLAIRRDVFDRVYRFKVGRGLATWEQTLETLLAAVESKP